ncbi:ABC transporter permease [Propionibacterium australiense]|uniref:ABC transporter permease n=1 Tax=Propionibacterium australiense TaxID=119981 RepID=UPI002174EF0A|nr:ABC transporter permease [Propionibacterium australiense]
MIASWLIEAAARSQLWTSSAAVRSARQPRQDLVLVENTGVSIDPSPRLAVALVLLVALTMLAAWGGRFSLLKSVPWAAARAIIQLFAVSFIVVAAVTRLWAAALFVTAMFAVAVWTTTGRIGTRRVWAWSALTIAAGVLPVLAIIFATGAAPLNGASLVPIGSIIIGNAMSAHTLSGRRLFAALRGGQDVFEAALSLGFTRSGAIGIIVRPIAGESLVPTLDKTRTAGLVTLPGAFIGVLQGTARLSGRPSGGASAPPGFWPLRPRAPRRVATAPGPSRAGVRRSRRRSGRSCPQHR